MCLDRVWRTTDEKGQEVVHDGRTKPIPKGTVTAYKTVVGMIKPAYSPSVRTADRYYVIPLNRWVKNKRKAPIPASTRSVPYPTGFHAWETYEGAKHWKAGRDDIVEVQLRGVRTRGSQDGHPVLVADEIKVLGRV